MSDEKKMRRFFEALADNVESLADEYDIVEVALAAVKVAHEAMGNAPDDEVIPDIAEPAERRERPGQGDGGRPRGGSRGPAAGAVKLFIGLGRRNGIRPQDLVGAIANESGLEGRQIGRESHRAKQTNAVRASGPVCLRQHRGAVNHHAGEPNGLFAREEMHRSGRHSPQIDQLPR